MKQNRRQVTSLGGEGAFEEEIKKEGLKLRSTEQGGNRLHASRGSHRNVSIRAEPLAVAKKRVVFSAKIKG